MPPKKISVLELQIRLQDDSGIIDTDSFKLPELEKQLADFSRRFLRSFHNTDEPEFNINIKDLKSNIQEYFEEGLSHLGFYFGLEPNNIAPNGNVPIIRNTIRLIMIGAKLDLDDPERIPISSSRQFSDADLTLTGNSDQFNFQRDEFKNKLFNERLEHYNHGLYIRLDDLMDRLIDLERFSFNELNIRLGFREADVVGFWNCLHLIFRGSLFGTTTDILFSTFDANDLAYEGPKLGIPPFGETAA